MYDYKVNVNRLFGINLEKFQGVLSHFGNTYQAGNKQEGVQV